MAQPLERDPVAKNTAPVAQATLAPAAKPAVPQQTAQSEDKPDTNKRHTGGEPMVWSPELKWLTHDDALAEAKRTGKPIMVFVYADWCPKCHDLAPLFASADFLKLTKKLVVVHVNHDDDADWLRALEGRASYVPRVLFLHPDGSLNTTITSGNTRYPFFYAPQIPQTLKDSMQRAVSI